MKLPKHKASLTIEHNEHKTNYETVKEFCEDRQLDEDEDYWPSTEDMKKAYENSEIWTMQIYPTTPIGFNIIASSTLAGLLEFAEKSFDCEEFE